VRATARALLPFVLHAVAREVDRAVGVLLHTTLDVPGFVGIALRLLDAERLALAVLAWTAGGLLLWLLARRVQPGTPPSSFDALLLRPALTVAALLALAAQPAYPYGFTLPVALTQDWGAGQDVVAAAFLLATHRDLLARALRRVPAPEAASLGLLAFLAYALLSPPWSRTWDGHPGNEPKTLRMAVALGHRLSLDVEPVTGPMESLPVQPPGEAVAEAVGESARHAAAMVAQMPQAFSARNITATRITRQTIRGKEGGTFHVLAPGTSLLLAVPLRVDRAINVARGTPGRLAVTLLSWNALAAWLVVAVYRLLRDASGRPRPSAALAGLAALVPPYLFYFYQFYPEMVGTLGLTLVVHRVLFGTPWTTRTALLQGLVLALLPWLHQKFLPVWGVLCVMAFVRVVHDLVPLRALLALVLPQVATLLLTALYNFAIAGSVRPDALFLAWGPGGVSGARVGQGLLGLSLDARFGLLPYAPLFLLFVAGRGRRLLLAAPAMAVYYATVAAADNWSGAVCNLGRYIMPVTPWLLALGAVGIVGCGRGALGLVLSLSGLTALLAHVLWHDPHGANDCALLLARSAFADGNVYVPNLFLRTWADAAPGLGARLLAWGGIAAGLGIALRKASRPGLTLAAAVGVVLVVAFGLEQAWPSPRSRARFGDAVELAPGTVAFVGAPVQGRAMAVRAPLEVLLRSRAPVTALEATVVGEGVARPAGAPAVALSPRGTTVAMALEPLAELRGRQGVTETLYRARLDVAPAEGAHAMLSVR
jgi:hypothetical protein